MLANTARKVVVSSLPANPEKAPAFQFSVMRWASAHGYALMFLDGYDPALLHKLEGRPGYFAKAYILKLLLRNDSVDAVMWIDSDAFVWDGNCSIDSLRSTYSPPVGDSVDLIWQWGSKGVNNGVFVLYNTKMGHNILDKWWELGKLKHFHVHPADQPAMHAAVLDALSFPWNRAHACEHALKPMCMIEQMDRNHIRGSQLPGVLSIPTPGMRVGQAAKLVSGDLARLQCTCSDPQCGDFRNGCKEAPSLIVHVGRPFFDQDFHNKYYGTYLGRLQAGEPLTTLWGSSPTSLAR
jgi:hypothetical protein